MTKNLYLKKMFANNAIFSTDFFWLIQAPNISNHISRNGGATIKDSRKTAHDKVFYFGAKRPLFHQKMAAPSQKSYSPKYVYTAGHLAGPTLLP